MVRQLADGILYNIYMWYIYAIYNSTAKKLYIGQTSNLNRRLWEHNQKIGIHFTAKTVGQWKIIYKEEVNTRNEALVREKQLKSYRGRQFIKKFIPLWSASWRTASC